MPANLAIAKKMAANGYDVYMLPNPNSSVSADFIMIKKGRLSYFEGKTLNGKNSLDHRLSKGAGQSGNVIINVIGTSNAHYIASKVSEAFKQHDNMQTVILLKGSREITITRQEALSKYFERKFRGIWNRNK